MGSPTRPAVAASAPEEGRYPATLTREDDEGGAESDGGDVDSGGEASSCSSVALSSASEEQADLVARAYPHP